MCPRVLDIPATCHAEARNPDIQVPENTETKEGLSVRHAQQEDAIPDGNPDIRDPKNIKREIGLRAGSAEKEEDDGDTTTESAERTDSGTDGGASGPCLGEEEPVNT
ncbi:hypothetical protein NDU88_005296 [Pleurodeles waltl]|uniref:Uncharacterized protein n=1 Tax=Pleurodeles waltl TaxID=8319 RepID=A0AAV7UJJ7_PLEWA|nr:hypothetical protein NDU88_005296 [Pleurodeles waltl]